MDFKRLARVYSQVSDIDALMRHDGGHYNEAINPTPLALSVDCGYYGCIRKGRHSFTDLLECCQLDGQPAGNACSIWENAGGESVPCGPFLPPVVGSHRESAAAIKEPEAIDWSKKTSAFRDGFLLRHGRDMRVLMSAQQSLKEKPLSVFQRITIQMRITVPKVRWHTLVPLEKDGLPLIVVSTVWLWLEITIDIHTACTRFLMGA